MTKEFHILVVDDDVQICDLLHDFLSRHGFRVSTAHRDQQMYRLLKKSVFDLIVLDVMMPGKDGLTLCRELRQERDIPIIILSAIGSETDRIVGLEIGADDYLPKPFNPHELLARIKALLRRTQGDLIESRGVTASSLRLPNLCFANWILDQNKRSLKSKDNITVPLSAGEYELLLVFIKHAHQVLTRDQLLELTRDREYTPFDRTIDVQIGRLRKKIEVDSKSPKIILTVRGGGYRFAANVDKEK